MTTLVEIAQRGVYFLVVGGTAGLTHLFLLFCLVHFLKLPPLLANGFAFLCAFTISYLGHKHVTFAQLPGKKQLQLFHFFLVACSALVINETLYFLLLRYTTLNYLVALVLVLCLVSFYTFISSRFWACR